MLGKILSLLEDEMFEEINLYYAGYLTELEVGPITRNAVKGLLRPILGTRVNNINAAYLATKKGISVHESRTTNARGFTNLLTVEIKTKSTKRTVVGTLLNVLGERIVRLVNY